MGKQKPYCRGRTENTKDKTKIKNRGRNNVLQNTTQKTKDIYLF